MPTNAKSRTTAKSRKAPPAKIKADPATCKHALEELGINRPYYRCRVVGGRLELALYGGDVVFWPESVETPGSGVSPAAGSGVSPAPGSGVSPEE